MALVLIMKKVDKKGIDPEGKNLGLKKTAIIFRYISELVKTQISCIHAKHLILIISKYIFMVTICLKYEGKERFLFK